MEYTDMKTMQFFLYVQYDTNTKSRILNIDMCASTSTRMDGLFILIMSEQRQGVKC